jgi:hypothetical protein
MQADAEEARKDLGQVDAAAHGKLPLNVLTFKIFLSSLILITLFLKSLAHFLPHSSPFPFLSLNCP